MARDRRARVLVDNDIPADYSADDGRQAINFTALRVAERAFKRFKSVKELEASKDFEEVIWPGRSPGDSRLRDQGGGKFAFVDIPGLFIVPRALCPCEQVNLITRCLSEYNLSPNRSSLDAHYVMPAGGLFDALLEARVSKRACEAVVEKRAASGQDSDPQKVQLDETGAISLMRRQRWTSLGIHYDWGNKVYALGLSSHPAVPQSLTIWARWFMRHHFDDEGWRPEGGIMNFYAPGDSLTGHVDRSEINRRAPLLSVSLGSPCIFLIGGHSREDRVTPVLLESGDVLVMDGHARDCFHGVPTILHPASDLQLTGACPHRGTRHVSPFASEVPAEKQRLALDIIKDCRININLRQVFP